MTKNDFALMRRARMRELVMDDMDLPWWYLADLTMRNDSAIRRLAICRILELIRRVMSS